MDLQKELQFLADSAYSELPDYSPQILDSWRPLDPVNTSASIIMSSRAHLILICACYGYPSLKAAGTSAQPTCCTHYRELCDNGQE